MKLNLYWYRGLLTSAQRLVGFKNERVIKVSAKRQYLCLFLVMSIDTNAVSHDLASGSVEYEDAISAVGFGKFNIMLMFLTMTSCLACIFNTTTNSFVSPSAECDLQLSLINKGVLNVITHGGMISSAFLVGYLSDTLGRKKILVYGFLLDGLINLVSSFSHNFYMLAILKFCAGFTIGGPSTVILTCLAEFHSSSTRPKMIMFAGLCFSLSSLVIPLVALFMLSNPWDLNLPCGYVFHAWQSFIAVCSTPSILAGLLSMLLPESPRFLASRGRTDEALDVLKRIYAMNTGLPQDTFPVKELRNMSTSEEIKDDVKNDKECAAEDKNIKEVPMSALKGGLKQLQPLFYMPHLSNVILVLGIQFGTLMGCNTLRLWLPQLFKTISEYTGSESSLCDMISLKNTTSIVHASLPESGVCEPSPIKVDMYLNSVIVAGVQVILCCFAGLLIGIIGKRILLRISIICAGVCTLGLYWCEGANQARAVAAVAVAFSAVSSNAVLSVVVDLFPTALRSTAVSLTMMVGRIGSIIGSVAFPALLASGCLSPFVTMGAILGSGAVLAMFIPVPKKIVSQS